MKEYRILFMGTAQFAVPSLIKLLDLNQNIINVYSSPPKKANRGMEVTNSPVINFAQSKGLNYSHPDNLKDELEVKKIKELELDIIIVIAYGLIIPREILTIPKKGCFNLHGSLLPRWRGAAPIQRAIIEGDKKTGITFMKMNEELDTGDIVLSKEINIDINDNYQSLEHQLADLGADSFKEFLDFIETENSFIRQNNILATYARKIEKAETKLNWEESAKKVIRRINAYSPNPGAWFEFKGKRIKILEASLSDKQGKAGTIVSDDLTIACGDQSIQPQKLKKEGKEETSLDNFLRGNKIEKGYVIQ
jgi:methionyl-tRNA formyltransferase|tara:strand:- start:8253 stop:9173 length:921 start_codon:yes stop_codon:yes gene_type:complete